MYIKIKKIWIIFQKFMVIKIKTTFYKITGLKWKSIILEQKEQRMKIEQDHKTKVEKLMILTAEYSAAMFSFIKKKTT